MGADYSVYVVELCDDVLHHTKFCKANPNRKPDKACLYVGMTSKTPDERFEQHKSGYKACSYVTKYGKWLRRRLYARYNPMTRDDAIKFEVTLAQELRRKGHAVWQR